MLLDGEVVALDARGEPAASSAAGPDAPQGRARHRPRGDGAAGRLRRLRHPARRRRRSAPADPHPPPRPARADLRRVGIVGGAARRVRRRRRPASLRARGRAGLGGARRQARRLALRERPAQPDVDQAEAEEDRVAGRRRLDRAARDAAVLRRAGARRVHERRARTRRCATSATSAAASPTRADAHRQAAASLRHRSVAVRRPGAGQRERPLGAADAGRRGHVHRLDQRAAPAPRRVSRPARRRRSARRSRWRPRASRNRSRAETSPSAKRAVQMWRGMQKGKAARPATKGKLAPTAAKRAARGPGRHPDDAGARRPDREAPGDGGREEGRR